MYPANLPSISGDDLDIFSNSSSDNYEPSTSGSESYSSSSVQSVEEAVQNIQRNEKPDNKKPNVKRVRNEKGWKKNIRKAKRVRGESYTGHRGIEKPARPLLPAPCLGKAKHKCVQLVDEENRQKIYADFRSLESIDDQRQFIKSHLEQSLKKRITRNIEHSRRTFTYKYFFTVGVSRHNVCREFFMATLNITDALLRSSLKKCSSNGFQEKDKRGKHEPSNKLPENDLRFIREHILSFPSVESHYCRASSKKKYLDPSLNLSIMHRMYKASCITKKMKPVTFEKYRQVFQGYNLGFFKPKKDQCRRCLVQNSLTEEEKIQREDEYKRHLERKDAAREARDEDKTTAKGNPQVLGFNFDLQAVLNTPKGSAGQIFYLRKLAVYNLTMYNLGNQKVKCYLWDETQGKRGANEIASCVYDFIMSHIEITEVRMMSDGCGGQQKNSVFSSMCMHLLRNHQSLQVIDHRFFETGHSEMECDSIHSKIERKAKYVPVYTPDGWAQLIRGARVSPEPFDVKNILFDEFFDFKGFSSSSLNFKIPWRSVCWLRYLKDEPSKLYYKTSFSEDFAEVDCRKIRNRGRPITPIVKKAFSSELPISEAKKADLQKMCKDLTIPRAYHYFYESLKTSRDVRDNLPEPDIDEESQTDSD